MKLTCWQTPPAAERGEPGRMVTSVMFKFRTFATLLRKSYLGKKKKMKHHLWCCLPGDTRNSAVFFSWHFLKSDLCAVNPEHCRDYNHNSVRTVKLLHECYNSRLGNCSPVQLELISAYGSCLSCFCVSQLASGWVCGQKGKNTDTLLIPGITLCLHVPWVTNVIRSYFLLRK